MVSVRDLQKREPKDIVNNHLKQQASSPTTPRPTSLDSIIIAGQNPKKHPFSPPSAMGWWVIVGEAKPKVYTDNAAARRACTISTWEIESFSSLKEAAERRKELLKTQNSTKRPRNTTPVVSQRDFERMAGVVEDKDESGFGSWLNAQQMGSGSSHFDAKVEKTLQQKRQSDREWFEEFKRKEAARKERRKKPRKEDKGQREYHAPPPSRSKDSQWTTCLKTLEIDSVVNLKFSELKKKHRKLVLKHHPDKHEAKDQAEQTTLFRAIQEAYELIKETLFPRD